MRAGELFAGYGGLGLAVEEVFAAETAWVAEVEPAPSKVLAAHWPDAPNLGDVTAVDWAAVEPVDIISGGFPCQDLSFAGRRVGMVKGSRSNLFHEVIRCISQMRPRYVVLENVRGLLSGGGEGFEPIDRCLCGWPYRRRGLHPDPAQQGADVSPSGDCGDDRKGPGSPALDAPGVRRSNQDGPAGDGSMGRGARLDSGGGVGNSASRARAALLGAEARTGEDRAASQPDQAGAAPALVAPPEWIAGVDGRGAGEVRNTEAAHARVEPQRSRVEGLDWSPAAGRAPHCPSCGRPVDDRPGRPVQRSWMGTVQRELARVGYDAQWRGLRAADVGAPHGRYRIFVLAADTRGETERFGSGLCAGEPVWVGRRRPDHHTGSDVADADQSRRQGAESARGRHLSARGAAADAWATDGTERRPEPARLERRSDAAESGDASPADADGYGLQSVGRLEPVGRDVDGRGSADTAWGVYEPAIRRWERVLGRPAPAPTEPGAKGGQRLSPRFVEFLMGLPAGWVTDIPGVSRNDQLKALGNGVVPQQAAAALRIMLAAEAVAA